MAAPKSGMAGLLRKPETGNPYGIRNAERNLVSGLFRNSDDVSSCIKQRNLLKYLFGKPF